MKEKTQKKGQRGITNDRRRREEKRENIEALYEGLKILKQVEYESARRMNICLD